VSEQAPEATTQAPPRTTGGKLGVWGRKVGPLPVWAWVGIVLAAVLGFMYYKNKNSAGASTTTASTAAAGTTDASQIPEFVNQTYTTVTPPTEPTTSGSTPPPTTGGTPSSNQIPGHHVITSNGTQTLAQLAAANGTTAANIIAFSKAHKPHISATEAKFFSKPTGKIPKGIVLWVPESQVTNITGPGPGGA
jgi:hypothetical protein